MKAAKNVVIRQIGGKVAYYRKLRGLTQTQLADKVKVSLSVISRLERGKYRENISLGLLMDVANALDIDYMLLLTFADSEKRILWGNAQYQLRNNKAAPAAGHETEENKGGNEDGKDD